MVEKIRVADYVIDHLVESGVDHFFILVGGNVMYLHDAIRLKKVPYTAFHSEQAAAMAAEAHARITGRLACVVVTSGPGASNAITGLVGAFYDSVPLLVICGNAKSSDLCDQRMPSGVRQVGTFELPIHDVCKVITKYSALISTADQVVEILDIAIFNCLHGRPGPSVINFPLDIQSEQVDSSVLYNKMVLEKSGAYDSDIEAVEYMVAKLKCSLRPAILVGHGVRVSNATAALLQLLERLNIPVFTTQLGKDFIPYESDLFIGHVGVRGDRPGNIGIHDSDFILCVGTSLHQQTIGYEPHLFAPGAQKFVVEIDESVSGKKLPIVANYIKFSVDSFIIEFEKLTQDYVNNNSLWIRELGKLKENLSVAKEPHNFLTSEINLYNFVDQLASGLKGNESIITDAGLCFYVMGQAFKLKAGQRYIVSGGLGCMGYALPAAIGASLASDFPVIAVTGDGSMQMNVQELATLSLLNKTVKIFIINNGGYASIRNTQRSFFGQDYIGASESSGLMMPNWRLISLAYGLDYALISEASDLPGTIADILKSPKTQLIEVLCQNDQVVMPGVGNYTDQFGNLKSDPLNEMRPKISTDLDGINLILN